MKKKSDNVSNDLEELHEVIIACTTHGSRTHTPEENKVGYLYDATIGVKWLQKT